MSIGQISYQSVVVTVGEGRAQPSPTPISIQIIELGRSLGSQILQKAEEKGMAVLALKGLALGKWPKDARREDHPKCWYQPVVGPDFAEMALRFTLSQSVTTAIPPGSASLQNGHGLCFPL